MNLPQKTIEEMSYWLLISSILFELSLAIIYLANSLLTGEALSIFDMDHPGSITAFLQALHFLILGAISLIMLWSQPYFCPIFSRFFLWAMAVLLFYKSLDELFKIHRILEKWLPNSEGIHGNLLTVFLALTLFYRDILTLWQFFRRETVILLLGMGILAIGTYGFDSWNDEWLRPGLQSVLQSKELMVTFEGNLWVALQELTQLIGKNIMLFGVLQLIGKRLEKWTVLE